MKRVSIAVDKIHDLKCICGYQANDFPELREHIAIHRIRTSIPSGAALAKESVQNWHNKVCVNCTERKDVNEVLARLSGIDRHPCGQSRCQIIEDWKGRSYAG